MAKIHKLTKGGQTIYPATTTDAVVNPKTRKSLTTELTELQDLFIHYRVTDVINKGSGVTIEESENGNIKYTVNASADGQYICFKPFTYYCEAKTRLILHVSDSTLAGGKIIVGTDRYNFSIGNILNKWITLGYNIYDIDDSKAENGTKYYIWIISNKIDNTYAILSLYTIGYEKTNTVLAEIAKDIFNGSVTSEKLAEGSVTTAKLAENSVSSDKLSKDAITPEKITKGAVTAEKLAENISNYIKPPTTYISKEAFLLKGSGVSIEYLELDYLKFTVLTANAVHASFKGFVYSSQYKPKIIIKLKEKVGVFNYMIRVNTNPYNYNEGILKSINQYSDCVEFDVDSVAVEGKTYYIWVMAYAGSCVLNATVTLQILLLNSVVTNTEFSEYSAFLLDNSVTSNKIVNGAVTSEKLSDGVIDELLEKVKNGLGMGSNRLYGRKVIGIGDSLSQSGLYEKALCALSGAIYNGIYSAGGTYSSPNGNNGGQDRVLKFINDGKEADIVIYENVNDRWSAYSYVSGGEMAIKGNISDPAFMLSQHYTHDNKYNSPEAAKSAFNNDFFSIISNISKKEKGTVIAMKYESVSYNITIESSSISDGIIKMVIGDNEYNTQITGGMTTEEIATKINLWNFVGYDHSVSGNIVTLTLQNGYRKNTPIIDNGTTGVTISVSESANIGYSRFYFTGYLEDEFSVLDNWVDSISLYSIYKGIIEFLQVQRPQLRIVWMMPTTWMLKYNDKESYYTNSDGSYNMTKIMTSKSANQQYKMFDLLRQIQIEVCKYYNIEYVNCHELSGITPFNIEEWYNPGDIHPKSVTYGRWAEVLFQKLG